jgi:trehalose 6-phosphate synthase
MTRTRRIQSERPVLVVSNRLPFTLQRGPRGLERRPSTGGLVSALEPVLQKRGGTWVGWPGAVVAPNERLPTHSGKGYRVAPVLLGEAEISRFYHGLANRTLWPLFHSLHERARFDRRDWETYAEVNARFAEVTVA